MKRKTLEMLYDFLVALDKDFNEENPNLSTINNNRFSCDFERTKEGFRISNIRHVKTS